MTKIDLGWEAMRLLGPLVLIFVSVYACKKRRWAKLGRNLSLAAAAGLIAAELAGFGLVVPIAFPERILDAGAWLLLAVAWWFVINAEFERKWGGGGA